MYSRFQGNKYPISENFRNLVVTERNFSNELLPMYITFKPVGLVLSDNENDGEKLILNEKKENNNVRIYN